MWFYKGRITKQLAMALLEIVHVKKDKAEPTLHVVSQCQRDMRG